jgi:hypothetical protein
VDVRIGAFVLVGFFVEVGRGMWVSAGVAVCVRVGSTVIATVGRSVG